MFGDISHRNKWREKTRAMNWERNIRVLFFLCLPLLLLKRQMVVIGMFKVNGINGFFVSVPSPRPLFRYYFVVTLLHQ